MRNTLKKIFLPLLLIVLAACNSNQNNSEGAPMNLVQGGQMERAAGRLLYAESGANAEWGTLSALAISFGGEGVLTTGETRALRVPASLSDMVLAGNRIYYIAGPQRELYSVAPTFEGEPPRLHQENVRGLCGFGQTVLYYDANGLYELGGGRNDQIRAQGILGVQMDGENICILRAGLCEIYTPEATEGARPTIPMPGIAPVGGRYYWTVQEGTGYYLAGPPSGPGDPDAGIYRVSEDGERELVYPGGAVGFNLWGSLLYVLRTDGGCDVINFETQEIYSAPVAAPLTGSLALYLFEEGAYYLDKNIGQLMFFPHGGAAPTALGEAGGMP